MRASTLAGQENHSTRCWCSPTPLSVGHDDTPESSSYNGLPKRSDKVAKSKHDKAAEKLAKNEGVDYNRGAGADIQATRRAIEVETEKTANDGLRQLQGYRKPVYIAGADAKATEAALQATQGTTVGVINRHGKVVKPSTRKKK